jgi:AcrR family transcriptional regulator
VVRPRPVPAVPVDPDLPVRDRILTTACRLFYEEGIQAVGIQRIIDEAGIAKASLYAHFASKDELVTAYLEEKGKSMREVIESHLASPRLGPKAKVLKMFDLMGAAAATPGFRGCAFQNASAEVADPGHPIRVAARRHRAWIHEAFAKLAREIAGPAGGDRLAGALMVVYDGAAATTHIDGNPDAVRHARWAAEKLLG